MNADQDRSAFQTSVYSFICNKYFTLVKVMRYLEHAPVKKGVKAEITLEGATVHHKAHTNIFIHIYGQFKVLACLERWEENLVNLKENHTDKNAT